MKKDSLTLKNEIIMLKNGARHSMIVSRPFIMATRQKYNRERNDNVQGDCLKTFRLEQQKIVLLSLVSNPRLSPSFLQSGLSALKRLSKGQFMPLNGYLMEIL